jgi:hypothetical protein
MLDRYVSLSLTMCSSLEVCSRHIHYNIRAINQHSLMKIYFVQISADYYREVDLMHHAEIGYKPLRSVWITPIKSISVTGSTWI